uniref:Uncharacterized protein n=1 Tax=Setaria viridis TaxID=4556 RepID=A0A4U6UGF9_SETVI|nr:hypothetical protein SEVIR_5G083550v2 [Setaria viridis]
MSVSQRSWAVRNLVFLVFCSRTLLGDQLSCVQGVA